MQKVSSFVGRPAHRQFAAASRYENRGIMGKPVAWIPLPIPCWAIDHKFADRRVFVFFETFLRFARTLETLCQERTFQVSLT